MLRVSAVYAWGSPMCGSSWGGSCMWLSGLYVFVSSFPVLFCVDGVFWMSCCIFCFFEVLFTSSCAGSSMPPALYDLL